MGVFCVGFKISEVKSLYLLKDIKCGHCRTQWRKYPWTLPCLWIYPGLKLWEYSSFSPLRVRSGVKVKMTAVIPMWSALWGLQRHFPKGFIIPAVQIRRLDQPGKRKWRPLSSISWQDVLHSFLLTSAGVATAPVTGGRDIRWVWGGKWRQWNFLKMLRP